MGDVIYFVYRNGEMFSCTSESVKYFFKSKNYYFITNRGSRLNPLITYHSSVNTKDEKIIGSFDSLVKFILNDSGDKILILYLFARVDVAHIFSTVNNIKNERKIQEKKKDIQSQICDENYKVKNFYDVNSLVVARFECKSKMNGIFVGNVETTEQKYIFEMLNVGNERKYREIFTGLVVGESVINDLPYIVDVSPFVEVVTCRNSKEISKLELIWTQNEINFKNRSKVRKFRLKK